MSEQFDQVRDWLKDYLTKQFIGNPKDYPANECLAEAKHILSDPRIGVIDQYQQLETTSITCVSVNEAIQKTFDAMIKQGFRRILEK